MKKVWPLPTLVRMEHLEPGGWVRVGEYNLLHPERVPERYREHGKFARCTELDDRLRPTGKVWVADDVPDDPSVLVRAAEGRGQWKLPEPDKTCPLCGDEHLPPFDGRCLL